MAKLQLRDCGSAKAWSAATVDRTCIVTFQLVKSTRGMKVLSLLNMVHSSGSKGQEKMNVSTMFYSEELRRMTARKLDFFLPM